MKRLKTLQNRHFLNPCNLTGKSLKSQSMIKIRFQKLGAKNKVYYRIVVIDKNRKVTGKYIDLLGYYNPSNKDFKIDKDKYDKWASLGAQISRTVSRLVEKK